MSISAAKILTTSKSLSTSMAVKATAFQLSHIHLLREVHSLSHLITQSFTHQFVRSFIRPSVHSTHLFTYSLIHINKISILNSLYLLINMSIVQPNLLLLHCCRFIIVIIIFVIFDSSGNNRLYLLTFLQL